MLPGYVIHVIIMEDTLKPVYIRPGREGERGRVVITRFEVRGGAGLQHMRNA